MKKILGSLLFVLVLLTVTSPVQAQLDKFPISPAIATEVRDFQIDTLKAGVIDTTILFYVPYSMNVIGITANAFSCDTTISAPHITKTGIVVKLYKYTPATQIAGDTVVTTNIFTSATPVARKVSTSAAGKLTVGACYKFYIAATANGYAYRVKLGVHYTR